MSRPPLPEGATTLLRKPNHAVIATLRADGQPVSTATWYLWEEGRVLVNMDEDRKRLDHLRNDPRVTLTVLDRDDWGTHVTLVGHVVELRDDTGLLDLDRLSQHYLGRPYPTRDRNRVSAWIEVERWHGWGAFRDSQHATPALDTRS
ncbi:PPOX class F420-dependent oxidoreductase [Streptomyces sp. NPDC091280]|uniref:PPOX class F420-dependent oxidoreductase n=1 Tax=Streptomyces sp. NPDC091280 TaxID=3365984 RepID=UPI0038181261